MRDMVERAAIVRNNLFFPTIPLAASKYTLLLVREPNSQTAKHDYCTPLISNGICVDMATFSRYVAGNLLNIFSCQTHIRLRLDVVFSLLRWMKVNAARAVFQQRSIHILSFII